MFITHIDGYYRNLDIYQQTTKNLLEVRSVCTSMVNENKPTFKTNSFEHPVEKEIH